MYEECVTVLCTRLGPLEDGLEEEEDECVSEGNELAAKEEFSAEENFAADFEAENLGCEDMEFFCAKGQRVKKQNKTKKLKERRRSGSSMLGVFFHETLDGRS